MANPFSFIKNSATISTTEYGLPNNSTTLTAQTTAAYVQAFIDFSAMVAGDQYRIRVYEKVNGGSMSVVYDATITGVQPGPFVTPEIMLGEGWQITVIRTAGADRTIAWSIREDIGDRNVLTWLGSTPAALSSNGYVQAMLLRWLTDNAAGTPAALSTNGYLQSMLRRWLTDDAPGTPNALSSNRVDVSVGAMASAVITAAAVASGALDSVWSKTLEGSHTAADLMRGIIRTLVSKVADFSTSTKTFRDLADTKNSHTVTTDATGRLTLTITDWT